MVKKVIIELPDSAGLLTVVAIGTQQINFQMRIMADQRIVTLTEQETEVTVGEGWESEE
ncbi:hypothetical protein [Abiotrophia defectiva]|uniref:hypothetical protein n=1 Tax=Abiotrophia defectiva TaxID=46125 RepID=UPI0026E9E557|nr:hypothetical protein [Abiotrophia defectiva]